MTSKRSQFEPLMWDDDAAAEYDTQSGALPSRQASRRRASPKSQAEVLHGLAETEGLEAGFTPTYRPSRYEESWLLSSLQPFYEQALIVDVLAQIKGGKEASVYRCAAHPSGDLPLVAAKVYRPRKFRNLRNDKVYRQGRDILMPEGGIVKENAARIARALLKKSDFGTQVQHTSWLMYEFTTLQQLHAAGAAVPRPLAVADNAILMSYHGSPQRAAPPLNEIRLPAATARQIFRDVLYNIHLMLQLDLIHGDLSAYNILYWEGQITLIDFPQVVNSRSNNRARAILERDIRRVCDYFAAQGVDCAAAPLADALWKQYTRIDPLQAAADLSVALAALEDEEE